MTSMPPLNSAALAILQQAASSSVTADKSTLPGVDLLAAANGIESGASAPSKQAQAKISEALFSPSAPSVHEFKINLMRRLGEEFGVSLDDFETASAFGSAIQGIVAKMRSEPGGALRMIEIERKLGLDDLGISLDTLINAIIDPASSDGEKLEAALKEQIGELENDEGKDAREALRALAERDENGLYGF